MTYKSVEECPTPYIGLRWTEMYSYYGKVIGEFKKTMHLSNKILGKDILHPSETDESFFVIDDTVSERPYILSESEFKKKFSYGSINGCWVMFDFGNEDGGIDEIC